MKLIIEIDTDNAEATVNPRGFAAMVLRGIGNEIAEYVAWDKGEITPIRDTNGNEVGHYAFFGNTD